jgi:hypothetical protein
MKHTLEDWIEDHMLKADGYDHCIVGIVERFGAENVICYDADKVLKELRSQGMSHEEAEEYFYFNIYGSYVGPGTPVFIRLCKPEKK